MTKNQNRKKIRDNTKSGCIISSLLPFPCSSSNKCCPLVACLLLSYSHWTASWLTATEEWWTWEELSSPPAQHSNLIILSCLPCWQVQLPTFLWWVAAAQSFPITHNRHAHTCTFHSNSLTFRVRQEGLYSDCCSQRDDTCQAGNKLLWPKKPL